MVGVHFLLSSAAVQLTPVLPSYLSHFRPGAIVIYSSSRHSTMFPKVAFAFLVIGVLSVGALTIPVARSPAPEPECESPWSFSITSYHDLTLLSLREQPKNSRPGCSSAILYTTCSRVSPRTGLSGQSAV